MYLGFCEFRMHLALNYKIVSDKIKNIIIIIIMDIL